MDISNFVRQVRQNMQFFSLTLVLALCDLVTIVNLVAACLVFRIRKTAILGEHPKAHKSASSGRLPSSVTEG